MAGIMGVPNFDASNGKLSVTVKRYKQAVAYFKIWCKETSREFDSSQQFVTENGTLDMDNGRQFLIWLGEAGANRKTLVDEEGHTRTVSFETFDQATKWLKMVVDKQLNDKQKNRLVKGYIMQMPGMDVVKQKLTAMQRLTRYVECAETDQRSDLMLTFGQMRRMAEGVLAAAQVNQNCLIEPPACARTPQVAMRFICDPQGIGNNPLQVLQSGIAFRGSQAMANRGMNWRAAKYSHFYHTSYVDIGVGGIVMKNILMKGQGEASQPKYTACFFHRNPPFCTAALHGLASLYRFSVMGEQLPDVDDPCTWHHLPFLRSINTREGKVVGISEDSLSDVTRRMLQYSGVELVTNDAITHIGRHQSQVEAQKAGVPEPDIERACNYELGQREKHYSVIVPISWQRQRAQYNHADPEDPPSHMRGVEEHIGAVDGMINGLVPALKEVLEAAVESKAARISALPFQEQPRKRRDEKIRSARALVDYLRATMRVCVGMLAARERKEDGTVDLAAAPAYVKFAKSPLVASLNVGGHRLIDHPAFLSFAHHVSKLEEEETDGAVQGSPRTKRQAKATAEATRQLLQPTMDLTRAAATAAAKATQATARTLEHNGIVPPPVPYNPPEGTRPLLDGGWVTIVQPSSSSLRPPQPPQQLAPPPGPPPQPPSSGDDRVVLGMDPGISCGWARLEVSADGVLRAVSVGVIDVSHKTGDGARCTELRDRLATGIMKLPPTHVCMELFFGHGHASDGISFKLRGVIDMLVDECGCSYSNAKVQCWKAHVAASGKAEKPQVKLCIEESLGTPFPRKLHIGGTWKAFRTDASDALGIALYAARSMVTSFAPGLSIETSSESELDRHASGASSSMPSPPLPQPPPQPPPPQPPPLPEVVAVPSATSSLVHGEKEIWQASDGLMRAVIAIAIQSTASGTSSSAATVAGQFRDAAAQGSGDITLMDRVMKRGLETAAALWESQGAADRPAEKRLRQIDLATQGHDTMKTVGEHHDSIDRLWKYWKTTIWPREAKDTSWRTKCLTVNREFNAQLFYLREVARSWSGGDEDDAVRCAQARLREHGSWSGLMKVLKQEQPSGSVRDALNGKLRKMCLPA